MSLSLAPHPRLYLGPPELARLAQAPRRPLLRAAQDTLATQAAEYVKSPRFTFPTPTHNDLLIRARLMQSRVVTLLARYQQTGEARYRRAVLQHIAEMGRWRHWSWIAMRRGEDAPDAIFDLSYGENCATLAIAYSWLHATLSAAEREVFLAQARTRAFAAYLRHCRAEKKPGWFAHPGTNWNTVCTGGAGMLALAVYEDVPAAADVLALTEASVAPFIRAVDQLDGGWPEGIGYWNYGFRYAFMYLLSHERATQQPHPLMSTAALPASLGFCLDFCPHGVPCSFGDVNHWSPNPFHYAAAIRLGRADLVPELDALLAGRPFKDAWPQAAELRLLHPGTVPALTRPTAPVARLYRGLDWGVLADRRARPRLYLAVRGGTTEVSHSHLDLTSYHCVVGDEGLVTSLGVGEYLDTTFSPRRYELFETTPPSKNVMMISGVGITRPATVTTQQLTLGRKWPALRQDSTAAMGKSREGDAASFAGRLFVLFGERAALVLDRAELRFPNRLETRLHSFGTPTVQGDTVRLVGKRRRLSVSFAATAPAGVFLAVDAPTTPAPGANLIRWCVRKLVPQAATLATLLVPGGRPGTVTLTERTGRLRVAVRAPGLRATLVLTPHLEPVSES